MKVLPGLLDISKTDGFPPVGITIGNFDGVHRGHQQLLQTIKEDCLKKNLKFVVLTFTPHPQKILSPGKERFLINSYEQRRSLLASQGVDYIVEIQFNRDFSTLTPEEFLNHTVFPYPNIKNFYLGYDFAFGANKQGGHDLVKDMSASRGILVEIQPKYEFHGKVVSSSLIRDKLISGRIDEVQSILGRPFHLEGVVVKGEGRGKKIGFPTANIQATQDIIVPQYGVYVTRTLYKGMTYQSVTNVGRNPTFEDGDKLNIETFIFDFNVDIYGENLDIQFLHKVRDERKFPSVIDLIDQIKDDVETAKTYLQNKA